MYISKTKTASETIYYLCKSFRNKKTGKPSSKIIERIGTEKEILCKLNNNTDIKLWLKNYAKKRTEEENNKIIKTQIILHENSRLKKGNSNLKNGGYLFLENLLVELGLKEVCQKISKEKKLSFDLFHIASRLVIHKLYSPRKGANTKSFARRLIEEPDFTNHDVYKTMLLLSEYADEIQLNIMKKIEKFYPCKGKNLFIDTEVFYFNEVSVKENIGKTIVRLYLNENAMPIAFSWSDEDLKIKNIDCFINKKYFKAKLWVCPGNNRINAKNIINKYTNSAEIQLIDLNKLSDANKDWIMDRSNWHTITNKNNIDLESLQNTLNFGNLSSSEYYKLMNTVYFKRKQITVNNKKTYFYAFFNFEIQQWKQETRKERLEKIIQNFGEPNNKQIINSAKKEILDISESSIFKNSIKTTNEFDGFYAYISDLSKNHIISIMNILYCKTQLVELFKIIKNEYYSRQEILPHDSINAHLLTSFLALQCFMLLEEKLKYKYWNAEVYNTLLNMNFFKVGNRGWLSTYSPTKLTDDLQDIFNIETDFEFINKQKMEEIIEQIKNPKSD